MNDDNDINKTPPIEVGNVIVGNKEQPSSEEVDFDAVQEKIGEVGDIVTEAEEFKKKCLGTPEAEDMAKLAQEAKDLERHFLKSLGEILKYPLIKYKEFKDKKRREALAIPDNREIITELESRLKKLRIQLFKHGHFDKRDRDEYLILAETYKRANKVEEDKMWFGVNFSLSELGYTLVSQSLTEDDVGDVLFYYDTYGIHSINRDGFTDGDRIVEKVMEPYLQTDYVATDDVDFDLLRDKNVFLNQVNVETDAILDGRVELGQIRQRKMEELQKRLFSPREMVYLSWSEEELNKIKKLSREIQKRFVAYDSLWKSGAKQLLDEPRLEQIFDFYDLFGGVVKDFKMDYLPSILDKIIKQWPDAEKLRGLLQKVKDNLNKDSSKEGGEKLSDLDPATLYTLLFLAERDDGAEILQKFNLKEIKNLSLAQLIDSQGIARYFEDEDSHDHLLSFAGYKYGRDLISLNQEERFFSFVREYQVELAFAFRNGSDVWSSGGPFLSIISLVEKWYSFVIFLPEQYKHKILELAALDSYNHPGDLREEMDKIDWRVVDNFLEYNELCPKELQLGLGKLFYNQTFFEEERWAQIKPLIEKVDPSIINLLIKKSNPEVLLTILENYSDETNELVSIFCENGDNYIHNFGRGQHKKIERGPEVVKEIFKLTAFCQANFGSGKEMNWTFFIKNKMVNESDTKILELLLSGNFEQIKNAVDLPLLEGRMMSLAQMFGSDRSLDSFYRFGSLSEEDKGFCLRLLDLGYDRGSIEKIINSGKSEQVLQLLEQHGFRFSIDTLLLMAEHLGCIGFFNYVRSDFYVEVERIQKIINLYNLGLSRSYETDGSIFGNISDNYGEFWRELALWDEAKLVAVANFFADDSRVDLKELMRIDDHQIFTAEQLINRLKVYLVTGDWFVLFRADPDKPLPEDRAEFLEQKFIEVEEIIGKTLEGRQKNKLTYKGDWLITEEVWDYLKANPQIFKFFIESERPFFYDNFLSIDQEILGDPRFWNSNLSLDSEIIKDVSLVKRFLTLKDLFTQANLVFDQSFDSEVKTEEDLKIFESVLFLVEKLFNKNKKYNSRNLVELLKLCHGDKAMAEDCLDFIVEIFDADKGYRFSEAVELVLGLSEKEKQLLFEIRSLVGADLPLNIIQKTLHLLSSCETAEDYLEVVENDEEMKDKFEFREWVCVRRQGAMMNIIEKFPDIINLSVFEEYLHMYFGDFSKSLDLDIARNLSGLSEHGLQNFEAFFGIFLGNKDQNGPNFINQELIGFFESSKAKLLIDWLKNQKNPSNLVGQLFLNGQDKLDNFLSAVDSDVLDQYTNLPQYLYLNLLDAPLFFRDPVAQKVIDYAKKMKELFGGNDGFRLSVYDLLLADFTKDWENLQKIENNSFFGLTKDVLESLVEGRGDFEEIAQKTLAFTGDSNKVEIEVMLDGLEKLSPDLRKSILFGLIGDYGIRFLEKEDLVKEKFNLSDEGWQKFVMKVCASHRYLNSEIQKLQLIFSPDVWKMLLANTDLEVNTFLAKSNFEIGQSWYMLLENKLKIHGLFKNGKSDLLFDKFKDLLDFWDFVLMEYPKNIFTNWNDGLSEFLQGQRLEILIEKCLSNAGSSLCGSLLSKFLEEKIALTSKQVQFLSESALVERSMVNPIQVLLLYFDGKIVLPLEKLKNSVDLFLNGDFALNFSRSEIRQLFEERFQEILNQEPVDVRLSLLIFEKLNNVNLLNEKYSDIMLGIIDRQIHIGIDDSTLGRFTNLLITSTSREGGFHKTDKEKEPFTKLTISRDNWLPLLLTFVSIDDIRIDPEAKEQIVGLFKGDEAKNFCLSNVQELWGGYLASAEPGKIPLSLMLIVTRINSFGAGPLSQLEALGEFIYTFYRVLNKRGVEDETQQKLIKGEVNVEDRLKKGRSNSEDRSDYYHISSYMVSADPELFAIFLDIFDELSATQFKQFIREIYPLYRAQLVLLEKNGQHLPEDLGMFKEMVISFIDNLKEKGAGAFVEIKGSLINEIKNIFRNKFGIIKIPDDFSEEFTRTLTNFSVYLGNLNDRNFEKETMLGFYLALIINGQWEKFRSGEEIDVSEYLIPEKSGSIKEILEKRKELTPLKTNKFGISEEELPRFKTILQSEVQNVVIGEVETVDVKLTNVLINLEGLADLDLYPDLLDKVRLQLLFEFGNKRVGTTVAKMFQEQKNPDRPVQFTDEELLVKEKIESIIREQGLATSPETIKQYFQDGLKPFSAVANILNFAKEVGVSTEVEKLRELLMPSSQIIEVFNRFGEEFKVSSGAVAVAQDLNYLDNLITKKTNELTAEEKILLSEYVGQIREQLVKLENIYEQIKNKFISFKQSSSGLSNELLREKLNEIDRIINDQSTARAITSTMTNNFNSIIENIRECLSCRNTGCNNDTNLTFGDENKFFIYSQAGEKKEGSVADQIVFVEPVVYTDGSTGLALVLDRTYGNCTPDIFINHLRTVWKKYLQLKKGFPDSHLSVVIPKVVVGLGGLSVEVLQNKLSADLGEKLILGEESVYINVVPSATGDHYVEFGGGARTPGERTVQSIILKIN